MAQSRQLDDSSVTDNSKIIMLEQKKQSLFQIAQSVYDLSLKVSDASTRALFLARTQSIQQIRSDFMETLDKLILEHLSDDPETKPNYSSLNAFDELYCHIKQTETNLRQQQESKSKQLDHLNHKLPPLQLAGFDGTPSKWPVFYENFHSLIHKNTSLSNTEKIQYLIGCLSGKALNVCAGITCSAENYNIIWKALLDKYQDVRVQASLYLDQILKLKPNQSIDYFLDNFCSAEAALCRLNIKDLYDFVITHIALSKLDKDTINLFEQTHRQTDIPTFENLKTFLKEQSKIQALRNPTQKHHTLLHLDGYHIDNKFESFPPQGTSAAASRRQTQQQPSLAPAAAANLSPRAAPPPQIDMKPTSYAHERNFAVQSSHVTTDNSNTRVNSNADNNNFTLSAISPHNSGSMSSFITKACCEQLNLKITRIPSTVKGIGKVESKSFGLTQFKIHSRFDPRSSYTVHARVIDSITDFLPNAEIDLTELTHLRHVPMADDHFYAPAQIDCLIGNELFPLLLGSGKVTSPNSSVVGVETSLGYVAMGKAQCISHTRSNSPQAHSQDSHTHSNSPCTHAQNTQRSQTRMLTSQILATQTQALDKVFFCNTDTLSLDILTERFWEIENVPDRKHFSPDDEACEKIFKASYSRDDTGRYTVTLPFKQDPSELGNSYHIAKRRLLILENKLDSSDLRPDYNNTIQTYIDQGYLSKVENPDSNSNAYYMPHRAVYRPERATSKTRVVLDAGCKTSSGKSLNDLLYVGPNLQSHIFDLLLDLRMFPIALNADIEKMYFQVKLAPEHQPFQRILFRFDPKSKIDVYQFNRVCFGVSSSPYLAMRVVHQLAADSRERGMYPLAAYEAVNHMYMDDYVCSLPSIEVAKNTYQQMVDMFKSGGFNLLKWISNSEELMSQIPSSHKSSSAINFDSDSNAATKIVGMRWQPHDDYFSFHVNFDIPEKCTKRSILSITARLFDPIGVISPIVSFMKVLVQECWKLQLDWDDDVPDFIENKWKQFNSELSLLQSIKIPRHIGITLNLNVTLIGFADASEKCYGACVYIRVDDDIDSNAHSVQLLTAKSKVSSPNKTLARLELCAALLLAKLIDSVRSVYSKRCNISNIYAFSDSTVTLTWIHSPAYKFHTFVANRISLINEYLPASHWFHVRGIENPADIVSRPVTPKSLVDNALWFHGPQWLSAPFHAWNVNQFKVNNNNNDESLESKTISMPIQILQENTHPIQTLSDRISSWSKLLRSFVYILRFTKILKSHGPISVHDLEESELYILRYIQNNHFSQEVHALQHNKLCKNKSVLKLNPFIDNNGLLRAGGRLSHSQLNFDVKHPILLPKDRLVSLLIEYHHKINLHTGPALLLALLRQKYWIISARNLVRKIVHDCNICFKFKPRATNPLMGDLPAIRVSQVKAFVYTAVDYAGPFFITHIRGRGVKSHKAYICLFVCLTSKALHLELVTDLSTDLFLAAFKRFIARRGPVSIIYSDGGTNFLGAKRKLNDIYSEIKSADIESYLTDYLTQYKIEFKNSPPYGPHFNGISETNVKSVKNHLYKAIGTQILSYEEFNTILIQIENLLNSRPLCILSDDPSDLTPLTPNHFLNVTPLKFLPAEPIDLDTPNHRLSRYQLLNKIVQSYWKRYSLEYLTSLQKREKWNTPSNPVTIGKIVIIKEDNSHPMFWPLAVVSEVYPGKDNVIRAVKVRTSNSTYIRPVTRLCPLPTQ
ncbi:hypothetical protein ABMA28_004238 [Loxostege sticticalis]|uniref:Integrase catalytic domain-containing protein n=1 Tax=Loxostege sticticalis TaxID=481309 RepID=A0ABD0SUP9_LOXSC